MSGQKKKKPEIPVSRMVEDIFGCKWSLSVLTMIRQGIQRPGLLQRSIEGISTKVLNERLSKLVRYEILEKKSYPEVPPKVEYRLTGFGQRFIAILDQIDALENEYHNKGDMHANAATR